MILAALPDHRFLPAPLWLLDLLHWLTLTLHFVAMNALLGGVVLLALARGRAPWDRPAVRRLVALFPVLMAATVTLGVAPLLFLQLTWGKVVYSATVVSGGFWILVPVVAMLAYYALYAAAHRPERAARARGWLLVALAGLLFVSVVYSSTFALAERPSAYAALYRETASGWTLFPDLSAWGVRWLHTVLGAVAVGAFVASWVSKDDAQARAAARRLFYAAMALAGAAGFVYLMTLGDALRPFMRSAGIVATTVGILASVLAVVLVAKGRDAPAAVGLFAGVAGMVVGRHELRRVVLAGAFDPSATPVQPQWGVFALFVVCLVAALALIAWMLKAWFRRPA